MNDFVQQCRSEWKRLGVLGSVADDMAAELAADLEEAAAEGASAEQVLGAGAADPRAFARAWAAERGVIRRRTRRRLTAAAIAAFALVAIAGAALVVWSSPSEPRRLAATSPDGRMYVASPAPSVGPLVVVASHRYDFPSSQAPFAAPFPLELAADPEDGFDARLPGVVLLVVGLAGVVTLTSFGLLRAA